MPESVPVHCPACRREHAFTSPAFPCACGALLKLPLLRGGIPVEVRHRSWDDSWVDMRCLDCGRCDQWPRPELGCSCGAVIRLPLDTQALARRSGPAPPVHLSPFTSPIGTARPPAPAPRPPFRPITIRTAQDACTAAARYLTWLGFPNVRPTDDRVTDGIDLRGDGLVARVDPSTQPTGLRDIECLWLNCLTEDVTGTVFSLAGYAHDARRRADRLRVPLFVMDLTGTPQPVNDAADRLTRAGATGR